MSDEYSLRFFREHYIKYRGISKEDEEKTREAFMAGAHTLMLMITSIMSMTDPKPLMRQITQELSEFMTIKNAEAQAKHATFH
jgi:hypothetical protein